MAGVKGPGAVAFIDREVGDPLWTFILHWRMRDWFCVAGDPVAIDDVVVRVREEIGKALDEWEADLRRKWEDPNG